MSARQTTNWKRCLIETVKEVRAALWQEENRAAINDWNARVEKNGLLLDCQSDLLSHLTTRLVALLLPPRGVPAPLPRLNPVFEVNGTPYIMVTH